MPTMILRPVRKAAAATELKAAKRFSWTEVVELVILSLAVNQRGDDPANPATVEGPPS